MKESLHWLHSETVRSTNIFYRVRIPTKSVGFTNESRLDQTMEVNPAMARIGEFQFTLGLERILHPARPPLKFVSLVLPPVDIPAQRLEEAMRCPCAGPTMALALSTRTLRESPQFLGAFACHHLSFSSLSKVFSTLLTDLFFSLSLSLPPCHKNGAP